MKKINFEAGTQVSPAKVNKDNTITPAKYQGNTPLSPYTLNLLQDNIENEFQVDKTNISGATSQEGTPSPDNIVPIENVNVYGVNEFDKNTVTESYYVEPTDGELNSSSVTDTSDYIPVEKGTYKLSYEYSTLLASTPKGICFYDINKTYISGATYDATKKETVITSTINGYVKFSYDKNCTNIKLEKNSTTTTYTPYGYGLLDLNLQKDTDTKTVTLTSKRLHEGDNVDEWGFHYKRKTKIFNGGDTETWFFDTTLTNCTRFYKWVTDLEILQSVYQRCSHLKYENNYILDEPHMYVYNNLLYIFIPNTIATTVDELRTYLANQYANGTPLTIEYFLTEQENEDFDETNQTAWNTLEDLLINGYTFIDSSSDELQPTVTLTEHTANEVHREDVEKFKEIEDNIKGKKLWENQNSSLAFEAQTINLIKNNCDMYDIYYKMGASNNYIKTERVLVGRRSVISVPATDNFTNENASRMITNISNESITFGNTSINNETSNTILIPLYVIGYKTELFS